MRSFADHFSGQAADYAAFRPRYPRGLIARLADLAPGRALAWDCATGNGQAASLLAERFERVVATDASPEQIGRAAPDPRIDYRVAAAEQSGLPAGSVDLVTVAQALHWLPLPELYAEVARVLRPGGLVAAWCYNLARIAPEIDPVVDRFYAQRVGPYWPPGREHVEAGYRDLPFPFEEVEAGEWSMSARLAREAFLGYVGTWSAVARARAREGADPVRELAADLDAVWPEGEAREVSWPLAVRAGRLAAPA